MKLQHPYPLLFATLSGSRAFGLETDTSDYDIHGVHRLPLSHLLGFASGGESVDIKQPENHLEFKSYDIKRFLGLLLKGNGGTLEDLFSPVVYAETPMYTELQALGRRCLSKRCGEYYLGMAFNQQKIAQINDVKKLIHCYRCLFMGIHLMRSRELIMNVASLAREYDQSPFLALLAERTVGDVPEHHRNIKYLSEYLKEVKEASDLPDFTSQETKDDAERLLIAVRRLDSEGIRL